VLVLAAVAVAPWLAVLAVLLLPFFLAWRRSRRAAPLRTVSPAAPEVQPGD
jgi:hypothetical protein